MKKSNKFSPELRERAVRMGLEHHGEYPSLWAAKELRRANEILMLASAFFAQAELGRSLKS